MHTEILMINMPANGIRVGNLKCLPRAVRFGLDAPHHCIAVRARDAAGVWIGLGSRTGHGSYDTPDNAAAVPP
jgi:hypothetical protein